MKHFIMQLVGTVLGYIIGVSLFLTGFLLIGRGVESLTGISAFEVEVVMLLSFIVAGVGVILSKK